MTFEIRRVLALSVALVAFGCGSGDSVGALGLMHLSGTVRSLGSSLGAPTSVYQGEVEATIDRDGNGIIASDETYQATTDFDGTYSLDVPTNAGDTVVVRFALEGSVPVIRALKGAPKGRMILNATLRQLEPLECSGTQCALPQGGVVLRGLPAGTRGSARTFNPVTETDAFPGNFDESTGALLVSGVFASVDLEDGAGNAVQQLPAPAELRMRIPKDTWILIRDIAPGNAQIDVPLYSFDEVKGTWVRDANAAHLEDGDGNIIPPSSLASIRGGTFAGEVYAAGKVSHFSDAWNVDWPVESHGCVSGRVLDAIGNPAEGATVIVKGVSYTGSMAAAVGADGRFCVEAMRSEAAGEDLDGNGKTGEKARVAVTVLGRDELYDAGEFDMPAAEGLCGGSGCLELGDVRLSSANLRTSALCAIAGTAKFDDGAVADSALVGAWDTNVTDHEQRAICSGPAGSTCEDAALADETGTFSVATAMLDHLTVWSMAVRTVAAGVTEIGNGMRAFSSCPKEPVVVTLEPVHLGVDFSVFLTGNEISWTQTEFGISTLTVVSSAGIKWEISTSDATVITSPITYGVIPPGATQIYPSGGPPPPLFAGDDITVFAKNGASVRGIPYDGEGSAPVP